MMPSFQGVVLGRAGITVGACHPCSASLIVAVDRITIIHFSETSDTLTMWYSMFARSNDRRGRPSKNRAPQSYYRYRYFDRKKRLIVKEHGSLLHVEKINFILNNIIYDIGRTYLGVGNASVPVSDERWKDGAIRTVRHSTHQ
jgi:hypothetical protein